MQADPGDDARALVAPPPPAGAPEAALIEQGNDTPPLAPSTYAAERPSARRALMLAAIGGAGVAVAYVLAPGSATDDLAVNVAAVDRGSASRPKAAKPGLAALTAPARDQVPVMASGDPFAQVSFVPPPPPAPPPLPPAPPPPPAPPKAPPLPFAFVGLLEKGGPKPAAFLARGDALLVVSVGDVIDNDYRIDVLSAREIVVTYLPLNERQTLIATGGRQ